MAFPMKFVDSEKCVLEELRLPIEAILIELACIVINDNTRGSLKMQSEQLSRMDALEIHMCPSLGNHSKHHDGKR